jgi:hypothetical protein
VDCSWVARQGYQTRDPLCRIEGRSDSDAVEAD